MWENASVLHLSAVVLAAVSLAAEVAPAAVTGDATSMRRHHVAGKRAYEDGRFQDALRAFEAAFAADPRPELLVNIGQCHRKLGDRARAVEAFERFLATNPRPDDRVRVERVLSTLKDSAAPAIAAPEAPPAEAPKEPPATPAPAVAAERPASLRLTADDLVLLEPTMLDRAPPPKPKEPSTRWWPWVVGAGVLVAAAVAVYVLTRPEKQTTVTF